MMKQFVMNVEPELIKQVDALIKKEKLYSSRNEFIRDAIRQKVREQRRLEIRKMLREMGEEALRRGWNGELLTREERDELAKEAMRKDGVSID